jgi:AcrR family transcriptional regulator
VDPVALPLHPPREERADAARNRAHLLDVARRMVEELGVDKVTMDGLAERAGLGKGTVFRRFRTRAGIFFALFDEEEKRFQERLLSGPPPLGPGAPAVERLVAFGRVQMLLSEAVPEAAASGTLALQLVAALEGPVLLYLRAPEESGTAHPGTVVEDLVASWRDLVERVCG